jgi:hypothetical protein
MSDTPNEKPIETEVKKTADAAVAAVEGQAAAMKHVAGAAVDAVKNTAGAAVDAVKGTATAAVEAVEKAVDGKKA